MLTRRHAMRLTSGAMLATAATAVEAAAAETARGLVSDADGGRGIGEVMVSNGRDVVRTDADGRWSLPVRPGDAVFVIKPSGWMTPVDTATRLPRYSRIHLPEGTPETLGLRFAGIAPTGRLPESIDFTLHRRDEPARFEALLFADPQPETLAEVGYVRDDVIAAAAGTRAAFGITHGDVMFDDLSFYDRANRIAGSLGIPLYTCCGNHDINYEAPDDAHSRDTFKRVFGARTSAFQHAGVTFLLLDNVEYLGTDPSRPNAAGKFRGRFGPEQLGFVRAVLANVPREALVVASFHMPLRTLGGTDPAIVATDARDFLAAISSHPTSVSFSGHTHTNEHWYLGAEDGFGGGTHHHHVLSAVSGSWWSGPFDDRGIPVAVASDGAPNGYHVLDVDGTRYTTTLVPAHDPARGQMRIMLDGQVHRGDPETFGEYPPGTLLNGPVARAAAGSTRVVVNVFDGGPRTRVTMTVGDAAPLPMRRTDRRDPFVEELYARNAATRKPWVKPEKSTHIWEASLPPALAEGTYRVLVSASDEYGRERSAAMVLEVTG